MKDAAFKDNATYKYILHTAIVYQIRLFYVNFAIEF